VRLTPFTRSERVFGTHKELDMPGNPREMNTMAERLLPIRIRIAGPPGGLAQRYAEWPPGSTRIAEPMG
jgi:hypothetical protein